MKLAICSDLHLNFLNNDARVNFLKSINTFDCDGLLIAGDIAEGHLLEETFEEMSLLVKKPIYYINGNHDYYCSSFDEIKILSREITDKYDNIFWLEGTKPIINNGVAICGCDGWYDAGYGNFLTTGFQLCDFDLIKDFKLKSKEELLGMFVAFADVAVEYIHTVLDRALYENKIVVFTTHVPPYRELAKHVGNPTDFGALPFFVSKSIGEALDKIASRHMSKRLIVVCGHTHSYAYIREGNIAGMCCNAKYCKPVINFIMEPGKNI